jgi:hypothetical protein
LASLPLSDSVPFLPKDKDLKPKDEKTTDNRQKEREKLRFSKENREKERRSVKGSK